MYTYLCKDYKSEFDILVSISKKETCWKPACRVCWLLNSTPQNSSRALAVGFAPDGRSDEVPRGQADLQLGSIGRYNADQHQGCDFGLIKL